MPTLTVVAGPNGSGKSTLTRLAREAFQDVPVLDPDAVAKKLAATATSASSAIDAGREVLATAQRLLGLKESFVVETTLSGNTYLRMMRDARARGYDVVLYYVGTSRVEINFERVRLRVLRGGHDVPEEDQRRRYPRSIANLKVAFALANEAVLFDNSGEKHRRIVVKDASSLTLFEPLPDWASFVRPAAHT